MRWTFLLPDEVLLHGLPRGAVGGEVVAAAGALDPGLQLTLQRKGRCSF